MEKYSKDIVENIKQEEIEGEIVLDQFTIEEIVDNVKQETTIEDSGYPEQFTAEEFVGGIKHEPERHFVFIMPDDPEPEVEIKEVKIVLRKFDIKWKDPAELFKNYIVCAKCNFAAKQSVSFKRHFKTCKNLQKCGKCFLMSKSENVDECGFCDLKFNCSNCATFHQNQDHRKGSTWQCSKCDFKTLNKGRLRSHYQTHVKKFSCETCKQKFPAKREFNNHQQNLRHGIFASEPESKFDCEKCIRSFPTKDGLKCHERYFHSKLKLHCDICGKTFRTKNEIRQHIQTHFKIPCPICQRMIAERCLKRHIEEHSMTSKFKCDECEKVYFNKKSLYGHKRDKHEIDQVQCDLCSKMFKNKLLIRKHMGNHLKVPCPICRKWISKQILKRHMNSSHSSGEKFLACNIWRCQQKFKNIKELKEHEKIHNGTRIYKCPKCEYQPKTLQVLKKHMKTKHETQ